jgi:hypothetical protein
MQLHHDEAAPLRVKISESTRGRIMKKGPLIEDVVEPFRMGQRTPLSESHYEIAQFWCHEKNCGFGPEDFSYGSGVRAWWYCVFDKEHVFQQPIKVRVRLERDSTVFGRGCPYCANIRISATNSLEVFAPAVAAQWHPSKNGKLRPTEVVAQSAQKAWWLCPTCELSWQAPIANRVAKGTGCPYCNSRTVAPFNCLAKLFPKVAREWHKKKNKRLTPNQFMAGSNRVVWWQCKKFAEHEWQTTILSRTSESTGCPFCTGKKVSSTNSLTAKFPEVASDWHPTRNGELKPEDVTAGSKRKVWWLCPVDERHEWEAGVDARSSGRCCPYCAGRKANESNSLAALFPELVKEWHPKNGELTPNDVTDGSGKSVWWRCAKDKSHEWETSVTARTFRKGGCPFCVGQRVSQTNSLKAVFPKLALEWHPELNGSLTPADVTAGTGKKAWWLCSKNTSHEWQAAVCNRSSNGTGCPFCRRESKR